MPAGVQNGTSEKGLSEDDVDLFARLLAAHQDKLYRVAYRMAGHHEDAQDLLQDALLEAYRSFKKFQRGSYFDKWLYRIMTNTFIDRQRHRKRVGPIESLDAPIPGTDEGAGIGRDIPDWADEPSRRVLEDKFEEPVQKALDALPPEFRMVLILSDVEEFSYEEISEMMETPIGTVRSRLHRARAIMRQKLTS
ncbi:MAG: sigma-70 family RNA polymerase sigma factor [Janthinobacterium lividum]